MNPAVGVTKILNNLQECIEIIDKINETNEIILPQISDIEYFLSLKKQIIDILKRGDIDKLEKLKDVSKITSTITEEKEKLPGMIENYIAHHKEVINNLDDSLDNSVARIKNIKDQHRIVWFKGWEKNEYQKNIFKGIITSYSNWEYPTMEIFPGIGDMLQHALGAEPLYIVDWDEFLLSEISKQFNEYYANKRLMKYTIDNFDLTALPQNSFGFIYSVNYLFFENIQGLVELAKNVYNCLMPGGTYLFVYNNSNDWWSVANSVDLYFGLVDTEDLTKGLKDIGYEIQQVVRSQELNCSYVLCKKPGEINYIKHSSVLAKIIDKPNDLM